MVPAPRRRSPIPRRGQTKFPNDLGCRGRGSNPQATFAAADFKSAAFTISPPRQLSIFTPSCVLSWRGHDVNRAALQIEMVPSVALAAPWKHIVSVRNDERQPIGAPAPRRPCRPLVAQTTGFTGFDRFPTALSRSVVENVQGAGMTVQVGAALWSFDHFAGQVRSPKPRSLEEPSRNRGAHRLERATRTMPRIRYDARVTGSRTCRRSCRW